LGHADWQKCREVRLQLLEAIQAIKDKPGSGDEVATGLWQP
jgi:hypothetical protein